jgi:hypothetical protein
MGSALEQFKKFVIGPDVAGIKRFCGVAFGSSFSGQVNNFVMTINLSSDHDHPSVF